MTTRERAYTSPIRYLPRANGRSDLGERLLAVMRRLARVRKTDELVNGIHKPR